MRPGMLRLIHHNEDFDTTRLEAAINAANSGECDKAISILRSLVDDGASIANCYLGMMHEYGCAAHKKRPDHALFYYKAAASNGWIAGYIGLGRIHYYGLGLETNLEAAFNYFATIDRADIQSPIADYYLGQMYAYGEFVEANTDRAIHYLQRSANNGYMWAVSALADMAFRKRQFRLWIKLKAQLFSYAAVNTLRKTDEEWRTMPPTSTMGPAIINSN